mgnify:CR=1 FL=1
MNTQPQIPALFSDRLRAATHSTHEKLDQSIMAKDPFASLTSYGRFLQVQHGIHRDVEPLYHWSALSHIFSNLHKSSRFAAVEQDLADLGLQPPLYTVVPATETLVAQHDIPEALGWLYVVEGSSLGAAFLLKLAKNMGLSESHGAAHMATPAKGRAPHWKSFKTTLNALPMSQEDEARAITAAEAAFSRVRQLVQHHLC